MGAKLVIAIDWDNKLRMEMAKELGADLVLGKDDDVIKTIFEATAGQGVTIRVNSLVHLMPFNAIKSTEWVVL